MAIKVIRNVQKYRDAAMIEIDVLRTLAKNDKMGIRSDFCVSYTFCGYYVYLLLLVSLLLLVGRV